MKKIISLVLSTIIMLSVSTAAFSAESEKTLTVLFSHDMHSSVDEKNDGTGGFSRVKTIINDTLNEDADTLIVDGGDFAMGTLYQSVFSTDALELRLLGLLGYDATTLGNHEFDYGSDGLSDMLEAAMASGDPLPLLLSSNIDWSASDGEYTSMLKDTLDKYGAIQDYVILQKGDVKVGLFGLMGEDSVDCAPTSGLAFKDISESAKATVQQMISKDNPDIIVCLSHSGTSDDMKKSEDYILAQNVPEIDIIVSGHTHTTLDEPIMCGNTAIVSCGEYASNMGKINLTQRADGSWNLDAYKVIPLDKSVTPDPDMLKKTQEFKKLTGSYIKQFGFTGEDQVIAYSPYTFIDCESIYDQHIEHPLGNLLADAVKYSVEKAEGGTGDPVDFAIVPNGVIRSSFQEGEITVGNAFEVLSLGIGFDRTPGCPLVGVYLTGKEIKTTCEIDASISGLMDGTMLFYSNLTFTFNPNRMLLNKVTNVQIVNDDGSLSELEDDKLYRVVSDLYSAQMLGAVKETSYGILTVTPKDKNGNPIENFEDCVIYNGDKELKAWYALADYLQSFPKENNISVIPERYADVEGRKIVDDNKNIIEIIKNPNTTTLVICGVVLLLLLIIVLIVVLIVKGIKRCNKKRKNKREKVLRS